MVDLLGAVDIRGRKKATTEGSLLAMLFEQTMKSMCPWWK